MRLIEFQGEQHYLNNTTNFYNSPIIHDIKKKDYCIKNNIPLVCIPYWKRDTLSLQDLLGDKYLTSKGENK